jgi:hypothetical protein
MFLILIWTTLKKDVDVRLGVNLTIQATNRKEGDTVAVGDVPTSNLERARESSVKYIFCCT